MLASGIALVGAKFLFQQTHGAGMAVKVKVIGLGTLRGNIERNIAMFHAKVRKALSDYTAGDNEHINKFLYRNKYETLEDLQEIQGQIRNIDEAIDKCEL